MPYSRLVQTVIETRAFQSSARTAGMTDSEIGAAIEIVSADPMAGDLIVGSGGCRKVRVAGRGKGKSGGYRVITYFVLETGVYLLWVISKGRTANLTKAQVNDLAKVAKTLAEAAKEFDRG